MPWICFPASSGSQLEQALPFRTKSRREEDIHAHLDIPPPKGGGDVCS